MKTLNPYVATDADERELPYDVIEDDPQSYTSVPDYQERFYLYD